MNEVFLQIQGQLLSRLILSEYSKKKYKQAIIRRSNFRSFLEALVHLSYLLFYIHKDKKKIFIDKNLFEQQNQIKIVFRQQNSQKKNSFNFGIKSYGQQLYQLIKQFYQKIKLTQQNQNSPDYAYQKFDLYQYFKEWIALLEQMHKQKKLNEQPQKIIKLMKKKIILIKELTISYKLQNRLLSINLVQAKQKVKNIASKIEIDKLILNKNKTQLMKKIRNFFISLSQQFHITINQTKTQSNQFDFSSKNLNNLNSKYQKQQTSIQQSQQSLQVSPIQYYFKYQGQSQDQIIDLKKLSQQIPITNSQLIDYTNCQNITNQFYDKFFKNYINLATFIIDFQIPNAEKIIVYLKIKCQISLTKLDFLQVQKIINYIIDQLDPRLDYSILLKFDDQTSKIILNSNFSFSPTEKDYFFDKLLQKINQLLIFYACLDHIIIFYCQKSISYFLKEKQYEQFKMISQEKQLICIKQKFEKYLIHFRNLSSQKTFFNNEKM